MREKNKLKEPLRVLGIDPGTQRMGFGVIQVEGNRLLPVAFGVLDLRKVEDFPTRLVKLAEELEAIVEEHHPREAAIEEVFHGRNVKSALRSAEGRGALRLTLARLGIPCAEYAARTVKKAVTGRGSADKQGVAAMVKTLLNLQKAPAADAADALAIALCHIHNRGAQQHIVKA